MNALGIVTVDTEGAGAGAGARRRTDDGPALVRALQIDVTHLPTAGILPLARAITNADVPVPAARGAMTRRRW